MLPADFAGAASEAGVDGVLTVDMPPEEAGEFTRVLRSAGIDAIFLLAPTSSDERIRRVSESASGFVYYVSFKGVTGANRLDVDAVSNKLDELRRHTDLPLGVGFGIRDPESAGGQLGLRRRFRGSGCDRRRPRRSGSKRPSFLRRRSTG